MFNKNWILVTYLVVVMATLSIAQPNEGFELVSSTWEKGISEIRLRTKYSAQNSGRAGQTEIVIRYEGVMQNVRGSSGQRLGIVQNADGTICGVDLRPATEVD